MKQNVAEYKNAGVLRTDTLYFNMSEDFDGLSQPEADPCLRQASSGGDDWLKYEAGWQSRPP